MKGPTTKADFYRRWQAMEFGNRIRMWPDLSSLLADGYRGKVTVRSKVPGGFCQYGVQFIDVERVVRYLACISHLGEGDFAMNESAPDALLLWQGELLHHGPLGGYYIYGSPARLPMRQALKESGTEHRGLAALGRLKAYCNANGYDMLMELLDLYPDAVVEFSAYGKNVGVLPNNNVIVWELREY